MPTSSAGCTCSRMSAPIALMPPPPCEPVHMRCDANASHSPILSVGSGAHSHDHTGDRTGGRDLGALPMRRLRWLNVVVAGAVFPVPFWALSASAQGGWVHCSTEIVSSCGHFNAASSLTKVGTKTVRRWRRVTVFILLPFCRCFFFPVQRHSCTLWRSSDVLAILAACLLPSDSLPSFGRADAVCQEANPATHRTLVT